jgi:hypothetical protein
MATYTATIIQPEHFDSFSFVFYNEAGGSIALGGDYGNQTDYDLFNANVNTITGITNANVSSSVSGGFITIVMSVDFDGTDGYLPTCFFDVGSGTAYNNIFVAVTAPTNGDTEICSECYVIIYDDCETVLNFDIELEATTEYLIKVTDWLGNVYTQVTTTDGGGGISFDLTAAELPEGVFNVFGGIYEFTFRESATPNTVSIITISDIEYTCINVSFKTTTDLD